MRTKFFYFILGIFFVTTSFEVKGALEDRAGENAAWYLQCRITRDDVEAFNAFRDSTLCSPQYKDILRTFAQDMFDIEKNIVVSKGAWDIEIMRMIKENSVIPFIVQSVVGITPQTEEKTPAYLIEASKCLPVLTKATRILAYYLHEKEGKDLCAGSLLVMEREGKELWFTYAKTNYGYLPLFWKIWKDGGGEKYIFTAPIYWKEGKAVSLNPSERLMSHGFSFIFDVSSRALVEDRGIIVSLVPDFTMGKPSWKEGLCGFYGIRESDPLEYLPRILIGEGKAKALLGEQYPKLPSARSTGKSDLEDSSPEFFIPLPSAHEDYHDVYDGAIKGLVDDYYAAEEGAEKSQILQTLCLLGESSLLLENIPAEKPKPRPEGMSDAQWKRHQKQLEARKKKKASPEEKVKAIIEETQKSLAQDHVASDSIRSLTPAALPDVTTATSAVGEDSLARERTIQMEIEAQNKAARDIRAAERAAKQVAWEAAHGGIGGGTASAAGAGSSAFPQDGEGSVDAAPRVMKWKYAINYIKKVLKQAGVAATLVKETGSSHFRLEAADLATGGTATDTVVYQHGRWASGGHGSWYQGIVERVLGNLGKTVVAEDSSKK